MRFIDDVNKVNSENIKRIQRLDPNRIVGMNRIGIRFDSTIIIEGPTEVLENSGAQYECHLHYTDGSSEIVPADSWSVTTEYATIDSTGYLTTSEVPSINVPIIITAQYKDMEATIPVSIQDVAVLTHIVVTGPKSVNERSGAQYYCTAYYDNGSNAPCTPVWSENSPHASISVGGYLSTGEVPNADQPCEITALFGGKEGQILVQIKNIVQITHVTVSGPANVEERSGDQYTCMAYYDDGAIVDRTSLANWSENSPYASINSTGYLTTAEVPNADQPCLITADYGGKSDNHLVNIVNVVLITHITIEGPLTVDEDGGAQYNCRAYYDDGTNTLVTPVWSENSPYASINPTGFLTTYDVNHVDRPCTISASFDGKADDLEITITNVVLLDYVTVTGLSDIEEDTQEQYTCTAYYDNATSADVTSLAVWTENKPWASIDEGLLTVGDIPTDENVTVSALYLSKTDDLVVTVRTIGGAVPAGLILPFNGTIVPDNWSLFNSANNRMIVGAGNLYSPGDTGGSALGGSLGNLGGTTSTNGSHIADPNIYGFWGSGSATNPLEAHGHTAGDHNHDLGSVVLSDIDRNMFQFIKSDVTQDELPINAVVTSVSSLASLGMSNINANNKMLSASATKTTTSKSGYVVLGTSGNHTHNSYYDGGPYCCNIVSFLIEANWGSHNSNAQLTAISQNFKRLLMSLWINASQAFEPSNGMIAMWESMTPPDGWLICDGTNGTPDLRDNFIQACPTGSENITSQGNNQVTCTLNGTINHDALHNHNSGHWQSWSNSIASYAWASHNQQLWNHNHSANRSNTFSYTPQYYALTFIMRGPELDYIEVTGETEVIKNGSTQYTATAYFVGGMSVDVTALSDWFADSTADISIDSSGLLTIGDLTHDVDFEVEAIYDVKRDSLAVTGIDAEIPAGLIVYYDGASIPADWEAFNSANNKMIIGAGSTYTPGSSGGSQTVTSLTSSCSTAGSHSPTYIDAVAGSGGSFQFYTATSSAGSHNHGNSASAQYRPHQDQLKLIRATNHQIKLPQNAIVMGGSSFSGLTNVYDNDRYIGANSSVGEVTESKYGQFASSGNHIHVSGYVYTNLSGYWCYQKNSNAGNHGLSYPLSITDNLKKVLLSLWKDASAQFDLKANMIGMWESLTPPPGWAICDGTNGTPDLRDCFIKGVSSGSENTTATGNNKVNIGSYSSTVEQAFSHSHTGQPVVSNPHSEINSIHGPRHLSHTHSISSNAKSNVDWLPPYYSLSFIMKLS